MTGAMRVAWCMAADNPGGPLIVQAWHFYDLHTLQPPPGPVIARWSEKYRGRDFRVTFSLISQEIAQQAEFMARAFVVLDRLHTMVLAR